MYKINKVRYCHTFSVYLLDFYRGFTAFTDFQEDINVNIATMRNDVTSGITSGVSNVTLKLLKKRYHHKVRSVNTLMARVPIS